MTGWEPTGVTHDHDGITYAQEIETGTREYSERWVPVKTLDWCVVCGWKCYCLGGPRTT